MNRLLLDDLIGRFAYPSVTVLANTRRGSALAEDDLVSIRAQIDRADDRLRTDVHDEVREMVVARLHALLAAHRDDRPGTALALFASPDHSALVHLGREVRPRIVIDDTFATRDLVADLNRTAAFHVVAISDRKMRVLVGNRHRLVERRDDRFPVLRDEDEPAGPWRRRIAEELELVCRERRLPVVLAGVERTLASVHVDLGDRRVGVINGNHDRTGWADLHTLAWPLVVDWLRTDGARALERLDRARSAFRYAAGIDEVFPLATEGRIELIVAEDGFAPSVRLGSQGQLIPAADLEHPEVVDDIVDDTMELVLRYGGESVIVPDGVLGEQGRVAAVLRY